MTKQEILEGNKLIAVFIGGEPISKGTKNPVGYIFPFEFGHRETWDEGGFQGSGKDYCWPVDELEFHDSWDWLFLGIDKINGMGKAYSFAIFKSYVSLTVEKGGKVFKDYSFAYSEYITQTQTGKEAAFKLLVKFVKWENENLLKSELAIPL